MPDWYGTTGELPICTSRTGPGYRSARMRLRTATSGCPAFTAAASTCAKSASTAPVASWTAGHGTNTRRWSCDE